MSVKTSGDRLRFYATQFSLVEVDSTYYGIPKKDSAEAWAAQTPPGFLFDVKSFSLFTNHPTKPMSLPPDIRADLPASLREKTNLYLEHLPEELVDEAWERFRAAVEPLRAASMPLEHEVTSAKLAVIRFHGRNHETWDLRGVPPNVRFRYDYSDAELSEWVPRIKEMERSAGRVHALMNNNYSNYSVKNAQQLQRLLDAWQK